MLETSAGKFYAEFKNFEHNPEAGWEEEFARLARERGWDPNSNGWKANRIKLINTKFPYQPDMMIPFLQRFPGFQHDPKASFLEEFTRLAEQRGWEKGKASWKRHWRMGHSSIKKRLKQKLPFFERFHDFKLDPQATYGEEFERLACQRGWENGGKLWKRNLKKLNLWMRVNSKKPPFITIQSPYFFDNYRNFKRNPRASVKENFDRLAREQDWKHGKKTRKKRLNKAYKSEAARQRNAMDEIAGNMSELAVCSSDAGVSDDITELTGEMSKLALSTN
ncbi:hypothetical protein N7495_004837 [Penicillium taxi]|uniref:uncharacterized protein n=1 Tax=Penicillium taxi TaxID=168475 RepID=UPI002544FE67|nr:uncharacterized protein N7495_004837 [Penicillium taxi]KAJ5900093.1 hypothetical protein N7495_004837 [Penicillium taxi]